MTKMFLFMKILWRFRRLVLASLLVLIISPIILFTMNRAKVIIHDLSDTNRYVKRHIRDNIEKENSSRCNMPELDPYFYEISNFSENLPIVTCEGTDWVNCYKSECHVMKNILQTMKDVVCTYRNIMYVDHRNFYIGTPTKVIGDEIYKLNFSDHVKIDCTGEDMKSPGIRAQWSGYQAGFRPVLTEPIPPNRENSFNVMILCFDSFSRNGFLRNMKNSYKYLTEKLNAVILNSYNIVGDGTTEALYPILTGKPEEELVFQKKNQSKRKKYVDPKKFIFYMLKKYGYRTAYIEDMPWIGISNHKFKWFKSPPADHYLRALLLTDIIRGEKWYQGLPAKPCIGQTPQYQLMINLAEEFLELDGKKFGFTLIVDMVYDNFTVRPTADETLLTFLQTLTNRRTLEDTLVLIMGDHGARFSSIRGTYQGKVEERLPLMAILLPEKLKKLRPTAFNALKNNRDVLTTPFDIHATILDVLNLKNESNSETIPGSDLPKALSLLEPIPKSRSCGEAGVMPHWCACTNWLNVSRTNPIYQQVANVLAEYINSIIQEKRSKCAKRKLISTEWVIHQRAKDHLSKYNYIGIDQLLKFHKNPFEVFNELDEFYQAKIIMGPGNGVFEGTMMYNAAGDYYMITQRDISRVSAYGDEPQCISRTHPHLNKYCFCKDMLRVKNKTHIEHYFLKIFMLFASRYFVLVKLFTFPLF